MLPRKQCNLCVNLQQKVKKQYFSNVDSKLITDNKKIWKSVKPLFSYKIIVKEIRNLMEIRENSQHRYRFNDYFSNVVQNLNIPRKNSLLNTDLCMNVLKSSKYYHHQREMRERGQPKFSFRFFLTLEEFINEVVALNDKTLVKLYTFLLK